MRDTKYLHSNVRKIVQPFFETDDDNNGTPTGVELIETLDPMDLGDHLRYDPHPNTNQWNKAQVLTLEELDLLVGSLDHRHEEFDGFAIALLEKSMM